MPWPIVKYTPRKIGPTSPPHSSTISCAFTYRPNIATLLVTAIRLRRRDGQTTVLATVSSGISTMRNEKLSWAPLRGWSR